MSIELPEEILPAQSDLKGSNILIMSDYGIGKTGLLASTGYLCADPEDKMKAYPSRRVPLTRWEDHLEFVQNVAAKDPDSFPGIGLDTLNVSYSQALTYVMRTVTFAGHRLTHPSENPQLAYPRVTFEFIKWLRDVTLLGYHVIGTCHVNLVEIRDRQSNLYNRWIPAFVGGSPESTYSQVLKIFPLVGFMTLEDVEIAPATVMKMGKRVTDMRADTSRLDSPETEQRRVIKWEPNPNYLANNKFGGFPEEVVLPKRWQDDWEALQAAWGTGAQHEVAEEAVETDGLKIEAGQEARIGR